MSIDLKYGVPTVALHTQMFHRVTQSVVRMAGAPRMRQVYLPHPVMGKTEAEIRAFIWGNNPITGKPVMQEVVEGLTQPLVADDKSGLTFERSTPRLVRTPVARRPSKRISSTGSPRRISAPSSSAIPAIRSRTALQPPSG